MFCNCRVIGRSLASSREELGEASDSGRKMVAMYFMMFMMIMFLMVMMIMMIIDHDDYDYVCSDHDKDGDDSD